MPRKKIYPERSAADLFDDEIVEAIWGTTIGQRDLIASEFEAGQVSFLIATAARIGQRVSRESVLIASLVDAESSLVFIGYRLKARRLINLLKVIKGTNGWSRLVETSHSSVDKSHKSVDKLALSVDKFVEKSVDKSTIPVENFSTISQKSNFPQMISTPCGEMPLFPQKFSTSGKTVDK